MWLYKSYIWCIWCNLNLFHIYIYIYFFILKRVMLQPQTILQYFYKLLIWPIFYWFSFRHTINITFWFTNNYSPHQQFVNFFVKMFVSLVLLFLKYYICLFWWKNLCEDSFFFIFFIFFLVSKKMNQKKNIFDLFFRDIFPLNFVGKQVYLTTS